MNPLCISNPFSKWKRTKEPVPMISWSLVYARISL